MHRPRPTSRRATAVLALALAAVLLGVLVPAAEARPAPRHPTTTTTTPPTTTTTTVPSTTTTAPTTSTTTAPSGPDCGAAIPKAGGGTWQCTWVDELNGTSLDRTKWIPQTTAASAFTDGTACYVDTPDNISEGGGVLTLTARKEAAPFTCHSPNGDYTSQYTTGMVSTFGLFSQAFGRFEVRAKLPPAAVAGLQESFWLWPVDSV